MKMLKEWGVKTIIMALSCAALVSGCGNADAENQAGADDNSALETIGDMRAKEREAEKQDDKEQEVSEDSEDSSAEKDLELKYVELTGVEDYYGDKSVYDLYAPKENSNEEGFVFYSGHGLTFNAYAANYGLNKYLLDSLESAVEFETEGWSDDGSEYTDVEISEVMENNEDSYKIVKAKKEDLYGTLYEVNYIYYLDIQKDGAGVLWDLQMSEVVMDSETDLIIDELAGCYDIDLDEIKAEGEWAKANEERIKEKEAENALPETILWFNATYAPLTYSNDCDWEVVGGMEPSEYNAEFNKKILERDWSIEDAASAMETIENLKQNGHREKCRECMEELDKMGLLDEKNEIVFLQKLADSGIEENLYRYVIAYNINKSGLDADYIAAWDLCRVNQLYADFYICGYMTYEEALDASLENSLILQKMYSSWDDMVKAYMLGYQFWQSDPAITDSSPTMRRYQCYLDLLEIEDGPYTLDWNMELEKSW